MTVTLRAYAPPDFETLYEMDQACYPRGIAYSRRMLRWYLGQPGAQCLVALAGDAIAGFIVAESEGSAAHIITLDVSQALRRAGVGTTLVRAMEQRLAERGVRYITLETAISSDGAVAFWKHHGYRAAGILEGYYLGRLDAFFMRKSLGKDAEGSAT